MTKYTVIIIGAGPTGLGAAWRLKELGVEDFHIFDTRSEVGGLASSFQDRKGFWWDIGGHVQFSHYRYFDELMDTVLPNQWYKHERQSYIYLDGAYIPYPFQMNIHKLPQDKMLECLDGLIDLYKNQSPPPPQNFLEWIYQTSGAGIAKHFLVPYNQKVWAIAPELMNTAWVGERVATTDLQRVIHNIIEKKDDISWGPNATFRFPKSGGTGAIWRGLGKKISDKYISLSTPIVSVNTKKQTITTKNGETIHYGYLISTMPLDHLVAMSDLSAPVKKEAQSLTHSSTIIVGLGIQGRPSRELQKICWMYFPQDQFPFYRITLFSKYSQAHVPDIHTQYSLMCETAVSPFRPNTLERVKKETVASLQKAQLIQKTDKILSVWTHEEPYGYPTPTIERDEILHRVQPELMERHVFSRGRFGMWKYEVSNQDHSLMQGVEAANAISFGTQEITAFYPSIANDLSKYDVTDRR